MPQKQPKVTATRAKRGAQPRRPRRKPRVKPQRSLASAMRSMRIVSAPAAVGVVTTGQYAGNRHIEGPTSEFLYSFNIPVGQPSGKLLLHMWITPALLAGTRLIQFSKLYAQYRFTRLTIEYIPTCPTTTDGSLVIALDKVVDESVGASGALSYCMGVKGSKTGPYWKPFTINADCSIPTSRNRTYACDPLEELSATTQFRLLVASVAPISTPVGGVSAVFKIGYTVEFSQPVNATSAQTFGDFVAPAETTYTIDGKGSTVLAPAPNIPDKSNGGIWALSPQVCNSDIIGTSAEVVGAFQSVTKEDGTGPFLGALSSPDTALAWSGYPGTTGTGNVGGTNAAKTSGGPVTLIYVGRGNPSYHT